MAFMIPVYSKADFVEVDGSYGDTFLVPFEYYDEDSGEIVEEYSGKWFCQLSAPGYMDQTDWMGPFDTLKEAKAELSDVYEVDPETGEQLEY